MAGYTACITYVRPFRPLRRPHPTYFSADAWVAKDIKLNFKYTLRPSIPITNIMNHFNTLQVHANTAESQYGQFFGNYDRHERFDLDVVL